MIPLLQELILKDFWLKLFSFALALLIWFTVKIAIKNDISPVTSLSLSPTEEVVLKDMPISILMPADESRRFSVNHKTADVTLQGEPATLRSLRRRDVRVLVDLSDGEMGRDTHRRIEVFTPAGLAKVRIDPEEVQFENNPSN
jgi:YbbR domain-containing protein